MPQHPSTHPDDTLLAEYQDYLMLVARHLADTEARAFAPMCGRRGDAHQLLLAAHLSHLMDGMGELDAMAFVDQLTASLMDGADDMRATRTAMKARRRRG